MKVPSIQFRFSCKLALIAFFLTAPILKAQSSAAHAGAAPSEQHLRSRLFVYDLRNGSSHLVFTSNSIWEAPNWSPDGKYSSPTLAEAFINLSSNSTVRPSRKD